MSALPNLSPDRPASAPTDAPKDGRGDGEILRLLNLALDTAQLGFWDWDLPTGNVEYDARCCAMLGYGPGELERFHGEWSRRIHPDDVEKARLVVLEHLAGRTPRYEIEFRIRDRADRWVWLHSRAAIVERDAEGTPVRVIGVHQDITEKRELEAALRRNEKLESLGYLTSGIAHNFNNLLGVILGTFEAAEPLVGDNAQLRELLEAGARAAETGADLTRSLLTVAGQRPPQATPEDLRSVVAEIVPLLRTSLPPSVQILADPGDTALPARIDRGQFHSAIVNVVINARDAMPGGGRIVVTTDRVELSAGSPEARAMGLPPGLYAQVRIEDNGQGIAADILDSVFDPFFTTKAGSGGTGLGLPMTHAFCRSSGGAAAISSTPGRGTTVDLHFPLMTVEEGPAPGPSPADKASRVQEDPTQPRRVLVVEDNEPLRSLAAIVLEERGFDVRAAATVEEAITLLEVWPADVVVSDVMFDTGSNGHQLHAWVRENRAATAVILTSGLPLDETAGARPAAFLEKPYRIAQLADAVNNVLRRAEKH